MRLMDVYGSKVTKKATGLVTCPRCKMRRRRDRVWCMLKLIDNGILMVCPQCFSGIYSSRIPNFMNTIRDTGWWVAGTLRKYDFRTYYFLTKEVGFGDYKEKYRWKNFKQVKAMT